MLIGIVLLYKNTTNFLWSWQRTESETEIAILDSSVIMYSNIVAYEDIVVTMLP